MKKEKRETLMSAIAGTQMIAELSEEMTFGFERLLEFIEDERSVKIIEELIEKLDEISKYNAAINAICGVIANGGSSIEDVKIMIIERLSGEETSDD